MAIPNVAPTIDKAAENAPQPEYKESSALDEKMKETLDSSAGQAAKNETALPVMPQPLFKLLPVHIAQQLLQPVQIRGMGKKAASSKDIPPSLSMAKTQPAASAAIETSPHLKDAPISASSVEPPAHLKGESGSATSAQKTTAEGLLMPGTRDALAAAEADKSPLPADKPSRLATINIATLHMSSAPAAPALSSDTQTLHYVFQHGEGKHTVNIQTSGTGEQRTLFMQPSSALLGQQLRTEIALNPVEGYTVFKEAHEDSQQKKQHQQREDEETEA